ncbi:hypothetical protein T439DRAFT_365527 [Meredithblackwellia eburnea MCA 4105]
MHFSQTLTFACLAAISLLSASTTAHASQPRSHTGFLQKRTSAIKQARGFDSREIGEQGAGRLLRRVRRFVDTTPGSNSSLSSNASQPAVTPPSSCTPPGGGDNGLWWPGKYPDPDNKEWPNGGAPQPGCDLSSSSSTNSTSLGEIDSSSSSSSSASQESSDSSEGTADDEDDGSETCDGDEEDQTDGSSSQAAGNNQGSSGSDSGSSASGNQADPAALGETASSSAGASISMSATGVRGNLNAVTVPSQGAGAGAAKPDVGVAVPDQWQPGSVPGSTPSAAGQSTPWSAASTPAATPPAVPTNPPSGTNAGGSSGGGAGGSWGAALPPPGGASASYGYQYSTTPPGQAGTPVTTAWPATGVIPAAYYTPTVGPNKNNGDGTFSGDLTYYTLGQSWCGAVYLPTERVAAASINLMTLEWCGSQYWITDVCQGCADYSIDIGDQLFPAMAPQASGRVPITWKFVVEEDLRLIRKRSFKCVPDQTICFFF